DDVSCDLDLPEERFPVFHIGPNSCEQGSFQGKNKHRRFRRRKSLFIAGARNSPQQFAKWVKIGGSGLGGFLDRAGELIEELAALLAELRVLHQARSLPAGRELFFAPILLQFVLVPRDNSRQL